VVELLLAAGSVDPEPKDNDGRTPLSWAAWSGHDVNVKPLLATSDIILDSKDKHGRTLLLWVVLRVADRYV
jgi:ankyrin repeat protein